MIVVNKIPFNIKFQQEIVNNNLRVETEGGYPVEIIKWNAKGAYPIVGLVNNGDDQIALSYNCQGKTISEDDKRGLFNLCIVDDYLNNDIKRDQRIIDDIVSYLEEFSSFDSGDEPYEEYCKRFGDYIKFMKLLPERLNKLYKV